MNINFFQPLHPRVVHFPIALFIGAFIFDLLSWVFKKEALHRTAWHLYLAAVALTPLVVKTGLWEQQALALNHPVLSTHKTFALLTMWGSLIGLPFLWYLRRSDFKKFRTVFFVFLLTMSVTVGAAAHYGGVMVYRYGVGVDSP